MKLYSFKLFVLCDFFAMALLTEASAETLSLKECIQRAQKQSLQSVRASLQEKLSSDEYQEKETQRWPQFSIQGRLAKSSLAPDQLSDANRAVFRIEQNMNPFSPLWKAGAQRKAQLEAVSLAKLENAHDVAYWVKRLYFRVLESSEAIERIGRVEELLKQLLNSVIPKFTLRRAPPFDLVKVKTAISDLTRLKQLTQSHLRGSQIQLAQVTGISPEEAIKHPLELRAIQNIPRLPSIEQVLQTLDSNPTLITLGQNLVAAELGVSAARAARLPELVVGLDYGYGGAIGQNLTQGWEADLGFRLPLFDFGTISSQVSQKSTAALLEQNHLDQERQRIQSELIEVHAHALAQEADMKRLRELLPDANQTAQASIDRYRSAGAGILETTEAIHLWVDTLLNEREAYYSYLSDIAQIHRLTGVIHEME